MNPTHWLTVKEVAEHLRVSRMTAYRLCETGAIESVRVGRLYRINETALVAYLAAATVEVAS